MRLSVLLVVIGLLAVSGLERHNAHAKLNKIFEARSVSTGTTDDTTDDTDSETSPGAVEDLPTDQDAGIPIPVSSEESTDSEDSEPAILPARTGSTTDSSVETSLETSLEDTDDDTESTTTGGDLFNAKLDTRSSIDTDDSDSDTIADQPMLDHLGNYREPETSDEETEPDSNFDRPTLAEDTLRHQGLRNTHNSFFLPHTNPYAHHSGASSALAKMNGYYPGLMGGMMNPMMMNPMMGGGSMNPMMGGSMNPMMGGGSMNPMMGGSMNPMMMNPYMYGMYGALGGGLAGSLAGAPVPGSMYGGSLGSALGSMMF